MSEIERVHNRVAKTFSSTQIAEYIAKPLKMLPEEFRGPVWGFWAKWSDVVKTQLSLAANIRDWIDKDGLDLMDLQMAFDWVNDPQRAAKIRFPGDLLSELRHSVASILGNKKADAARESERRKHSQWEAEKAPISQISEALTKAFKM